LRDDAYDEDGILEAVAPKVYEDGGPLESIREKVEIYMGRYNDAKPPSPLNLVLFDDALRHMIRIARIIETPRGSALLVGVGGSGKQSLTRLAAYVGRHKIFQITLTKSYNLQSLYDDIKELYVSAGKERKNTTFLFTDSEIKDEMFLEAINNILMTGQIPGLFAKDEMIAMTGDLAEDFLKRVAHHKLLRALQHCKKLQKKIQNYRNPNKKTHKKESITKNSHFFSKMYPPIGRKKNLRRAWSACAQ
jgi:dynein heavy chain